MPTFSDLVLLSLVGLAACCDIDRRRIPNLLVTSGLAAALLLHLASGGPPAVLRLGLAGAVAGGAIFLPLYLLRGMAAGDVKLMAMAGAFLGPPTAALAALLTLIAGGGVALLMLALSRQTGRPASGLPYAVAIALGTTCAVAATRG
ncbi:MAG TPA: prepilin peptidase [Pseudoduganella sp.]